MIILKSKYEIQPDETFENDILGRGSLGHSLINLISKCEDPLVFALNSGWGEGKTTFVLKWRNLLKQKGFESTYFNAFDNDLVDDAFIGVSSQIITTVEELSNKIPSGAFNPDKLKIATAKIGGQLLSWSVKLGIKAATLGLINSSDIEEIKELKNDITKGTTTLFTRFAEDRINSHKASINAVADYKAILADLGESVKKTTGKPFVFIVDELDRCKPTFAIELIENIKHLFAVPNITFLLVMNKQQLEESIKSVYGSGIDSNTYLQKFIDIEFSLPKGSNDNDSEFYRRFTLHVFEKHNINVGNGNEKDFLLKLITRISLHYKLSLRDIEKLFTYIAVYYGSISNPRHAFPPLVSFIALLKIKYPILFSGLMNKSITFSQIMQDAHLPINFEGDDHLQYIVKWLRISMLSDTEFKALGNESVEHKSLSQLYDFDLHRDEIIPYLGNYLNLFQIPIFSE